jgi:hypothetical protein
LAKQGRADYINRWLGREVDVLMEKDGIGTTENYLKALVMCNGELPLPGTALRCRLLEKGNSGFDAKAAFLRCI